MIPHRREGEAHLFLGHELVRTPAQSGEPFGAALTGQRAGLGLGPGGRERGAEEQLIEVLFDVLPLARLTTPPGRQGRQFQFLAQ